jgi:hypothetical protein
MPQTHRAEVTTTDQDGDQHQASEGNAKTVAAFLRSVADQLDPPQICNPMTREVERGMRNLPRSTPPEIAESLQEGLDRRG